MPNKPVEPDAVKRGVFLIYVARSSRATLEAEKQKITIYALFRYQQAIQRKERMSLV